MSAYGELNGHAIGIVMKELVRRAISVIRLERFSFEAEGKASDTGKADFVTTADRKAQQHYVRSLQECFPCIGLIGEEENLQVPCTVEGRNLCFTIDPLDGTKAFMRRQSYGVGTQLALVEFKKDEQFWGYEAGRSCQVLAAYVGDVCTQEIYGFRPDSTGVYRISEYEYAEPLHTIDRNKPLSTQYVQLREMPEDHHHLIGSFVRKPVHGGAVKGVEVGSGSIGIMFSRLWKGEVGAIVLPPNKETPWDSAPVIGITETLGFVALTPDPSGTDFIPYDFGIRDVVYDRAEEVLFVHQSRVDEVKEWARNR